MSYDKHNEDSRYFCSSCARTFLSKHMVKGGNVCKSCYLDLVQESTESLVSNLIIEPPKHTYTN